MASIFKSNYFEEIPDDIRKIIYRYTIPKPPPMPDKTEIYDFDMTELKYMDYLVNYTPTSFVMKKRYNILNNLFQSYLGKYMFRGINPPYSIKYEFNKMVKDYISEHSTNEFKKNYKVEIKNDMKVRQRYINRRGFNY